MLIIQRLSIALIACLIAACSKQNNGQNLLSIPVDSTLAISGEELQDYQQLLQNHSHQQTLSPASLQVFSERYAKAKTSIYAINNKQSGENAKYSVTLIFEEVPDEEITRAYRFDMQLKLNEEATLEITKMERSWRCWQGEGQQVFSAEPCS